jgi:hypothetical protein
MRLTYCFCMLPAASFCVASSQAPFSAETGVVDRIVVATRSSDLRIVALAALERVAEGKSLEIDASDASRLGLRLPELQDPYMKHLAVRAYAMRRIGDVDLFEALDYLSRQRRADFKPDESAQLWSAVLLGLDTARLNRILGSQEKILFLEGALNDGGVVAWWAANELCDRGSQNSLPLIRLSVKRRTSSQRGEDEIRFCEARIEILSRDSDRTKALGSVFRLGQETDDLNLHLWAARQLVNLHLPEADRILERYRVDLANLPDLSPEKQRLYTVEDEIRSLMIERSRRGQATVPVTVDPAAGKSI